MAVATVSERTTPLRAALGRVRRRATLISLAMLAPLLVMTGLLFVAPLANMLFRSIDNGEVSKAFPTTVETLRSWTDAPLPDEAAFRALVFDVRAAALQDRSVLGNAARRLNLEVDGFRSLVLSAPNKFKTVTEPYKKTVIEADSRWGEPQYWRALQRNAHKLTDFYFLSAFDLKRTADSSIVRTDEPIFLSIFVWSVLMGAIVTALCLVIAYPLAHLLAVVSPRVSSVLMFFVLLPFWTSILVRTSSWIVLLQREGPINQLLQWSGLINAPMTLLFNRIGVIIAMVHVMLPFMVLPLYSVMRGVNPNLMRAAYSMGAHAVTAFRRVYLPQTYAGIGAGVTLVFILTIGYYITPQLIGAPQDQLISGVIASYTSEYLNWGLSSALSAILLIVILALFASLRRFIVIGKAH
ncbi:MAG: ABC transporter permease [Parvibaculaceae bacterium]